MPSYSKMKKRGTSKKGKAKSSKRLKRKKYAKK